MYTAITEKIYNLENTMAFNFEKHLSRVNEFMNVLAANLGIEDKDSVYRILRSVLHTIRDTISLQESLQLMAQLPMFLKGVYAEKWQVKSRKTRVKHVNDFIEKVKQRHGETFLYDFGSSDGAERACRIVFRTLSDFISEGEIKDIRAGLPKDIKVLFDNELVLL
jgi:uncharacterized protein (DUF2267 family)